jgi:hypothetical protein
MTPHPQEHDAVNEKQTSTAKPILAWHWLAEDKRLRYDDKRLVRTGSRLSATGPLRLCHNGMHASILARHSLTYAPGPIICRVKLSGEILTSDDKLCARTREVLWMADATAALWEHALWCAEQALPIWRKHYPNDERPAKAIEAKRLHLAGEITDAEMANAANAAYAAFAAANAANAAAAAAYAAYAAANAANAAAAAAACAANAAFAAACAAFAAACAANAAAKDAQEADLSARLLALKPKKKRKATK